MPRMFCRKPSRATWSVPALATLAVLFAPSVGATQGVTAETHTVREGDTLWDLAKKYLGDPFLWPAIYRLNTGVVEDPHWIYPGEVLRLAGGDSVRAVPAVDTPANVAAAGDTAARPSPDRVPADSARQVGAADSTYEPLFPTVAGQRVYEALKAYTDQPYRPLRRTEFYSSGFLTEDQVLPFGAMLGPVTPAQIPVITNREVAMLYTMVGIEPAAGATYRIGDTLLIVQLDGEIEGYGDIVVPMGLARVADTAAGGYVATIVAVYGPLRQGLRVLPTERFRSDTGRAQPVKNGVRGRLLGGKGRQELKAPQMVVFIDKGRADGIAPGDIFEARRRPRRLPDGSLRVDELMAQLQIVRVGERTATARILNVVSPDLPPGTEVRQVAKLP